MRNNTLVVSELGLYVLADIWELMSNKLIALEPALCMSAGMEAEHPSGPYKGVLNTATCCPHTDTTENSEGGAVDHIQCQN